MDGINLMIQKSQYLLSPLLSRNALVVIAKLNNGEEWDQVLMLMSLSMKNS